MLGDCFSSSHFCFPSFSTSKTYNSTSTRKRAPCRLNYPYTVGAKLTYKFVKHITSVTGAMVVGAMSHYTRLCSSKSGHIDISKIDADGLPKPKSGCMLILRPLY